MFGIIIKVDYHITRHAFNLDDINYETNECLIKDFHIDHDYPIWFKINGNIKLQVLNIIQDNINQIIKDHLNINRDNYILFNKKSILNSLLKTGL